MTAHVYAGLCPDETQPDSHDPECPVCMRVDIPLSVQVGEFTIRPAREGYVWINCAGGEGGEFRADLFEEAIRVFYNANF